MTKGSITTDTSAGRFPATLRVPLAAMCFAAFFAMSATASETVLALFAGSYIAGEVMLAVFLWWTLAAGVVGLVAGIVSIPLLVFFDRRRLVAVLAGAVVAAGFAAYSLNVRENLTPYDALGATVLLHKGFLAAWGVVLGALTVVFSLRRNAVPTVLVFIAATGAVCFSAGLAHFVWGQACAYVLVAGPIFFMVVAELAVEKAPTRHRKHTAAAFFVLLAVALPVVASVQGELAASAIDDSFEPDAGRVAMLAGKPNVVLVVMDTTRADHLSLCGYRYPTTPNLEKLAAECRFFPNGVSVNSWTLPSHASIFTGKYPREHGARSTTSKSVKAVDKSDLTASPLSISHTTLATYLSLSGYNTAAFTANYVWLARQFGLHEGFSYYHDSPRLLAFVRSGTPLYSRGAEMADLFLGMNGKFVQSYWSARHVTGFAREWLAENSGAPFFLFLNYMDPHETYAPPDGFENVTGLGMKIDRNVSDFSKWEAIRDRYIRTGEGFSRELRDAVTNQYDGEVAYMDYYLGRLVDALKESGVYDETLLIILADHGEFFGEHRLLNHGVGIYEGGVRVPILVKYPGGLHAGEVVEERVSIVDVFATVFEVLRLAMPDVTGQPFGAATHPVLVEDYEKGINVRRYGRRFHRNQTAIYQGDWKYIHSSTGRHELYDLGKDSSERTNVVKENPEIAAELAGRILKWQEETPLFDGSLEVSEGMSPETLKRLRSLGYFGN